MHYRTDTGVHSLDSPFAVDLQKNSGGDIFFDPKMITFRLNEVFKNKDVDIRVLKTVAVKSNFKARGSFSCQRTYLYRFAVLKTEKLSSHSDYFHLSSTCQKCYKNRNPALLCIIVKKDEYDSL